MAKRQTLEEKLARLAELERSTLDADGMKEIRKGLGAAQNALVARAARVVAKNRIAEFAPDLVTAFERLMGNAGRTDKGCLARIAIVDALNSLDYDGAALFLQGIRHTQLEPVWGKRVDTAGNLRANCAAALVRIGYPEVLFELVGLVMDPEVEARRGAVRALVRLGAEESELLLRMKALARDAEADVLGECFSGLMNMAPERSLPFVARYLDDADLAVAECAALAIGESRTPEAFATLRRAWDNDLRREFRQMLLLPLALTRQDDAFDFLLDILREAQRDAALAALDALRLYAGDPGRADTVRRIVECRKDARLSRAYVEAFQPAT